MWWDCWCATVYLLLGVCAVIWVFDDLFLVFGCGFVIVVNLLLWL